MGLQSGAKSWGHIGPGALLATPDILASQGSTCSMHDRILPGPTVQPVGTRGSGEQPPVRFTQCPGRQTHA
eukprot:6708388-Pyramimonas_sp.AAC.1